MTKADAPTTPKKEETTPAATEAATTKADAPTTPKDKETTPAATKAATTKADAPTTPKKEETTPAATEAATTKADAPTTPKDKETTSAATEAAKKITTLAPKVATTTPEEDMTTAGQKTATTAAKTTVSEEPLVFDKADSAATADEASIMTTTTATTTGKETTTRAKETTMTVKPDTAATDKEIVTIADKKASTTAKTVRTPVTKETSKKETTTVKEEITTTAKKDKTPAVKESVAMTAKADESPEGKGNTPDSTPAAKEAVTTTAKMDMTTVGKKIVTTAKGKETAPARQDKTPVPKEALTSTAKKEKHPVAAATVTTTAAEEQTTPMPKPAALTAAAQTGSAPQAVGTVTTATRAAAEGPTAVAPAGTRKETTTLVKGATTGTKEEAAGPSKETTTANKKETTTKKPTAATKKTPEDATTTADKKVTVKETSAVSKGTAKPAVASGATTDTRDEPLAERLPVKEEPPRHVKPLIQPGDFPALTGGMQGNCFPLGTKAPVTPPESIPGRGPAGKRPARPFRPAPGEAGAPAPVPGRGRGAAAPGVVTAAHIKEEKNLCNGKPADGMVALQNGTLAVFRGHYYWLLNGRSPPTAEPRRIADGWGIPSPIDTVFSRCNCDGKTFFIKNSLYWRFTDGVMDKGYPKALARGFAGLSGKIIAALPVARHNNRPESVYFIKKGGKIQQYVYKQEPAKKCKNKARLTIKYPAYVPRLVIRRRFQRAVRLQAFQTVRINPYPSEILRKEVKITAYWRGLPKVIHSTVSVPNYNKPDGYDYYAFSSSKLKLMQVTIAQRTEGTGKKEAQVSLSCLKCAVTTCDSARLILNKNHKKATRAKMLPVIKRCFFNKSVIRGQLVALRYNDSNQPAVACLAVGVEAYRKRLYGGGGKDT
ncbi:proteoglycan 4 isoform X1 [Apteryx mantelli]|uniref:Proteoglycan 4 isoform X1 n=1 Tax=Apteryx mantelli TaxID=2696672 RepID=A0ABM4EVC5_9AVES